MDKQSAMEYVGANFPAQFKVKCVKCGAEKAVRKDVFANRVEKAYALGSDLKTLVEGYWCKKCQKLNGKNIVGGIALATSGSVKVIDTLPDEVIED